ncbi:MAG TPA: winged helix-turn-helix transcriptional regulator [Thermoplasmata archaeon]|nr:winged helix-turn-helix transcriptional regulator [Thermoplasmata archaeon]
MRWNKFVSAGVVATLWMFPSALAANSITFKPDMTVGMTIAIVTAAVAAIITFFALHGGIKYVTPENVLDREIRRTLYSYIDEYPGSHLREIARDLDLKPSNAEWHLRKLEQSNLIRSRKIGGKKVYYLVEGGVEVRKRAIAESILRNKNARLIMQYLRENPGKHLLEIARALNLNHHTVKWHIKKMQMAEMVEGDRSNSAYPVYYPTEIGLETIEKFHDYIKKPGRAA